MLHAFDHVVIAVRDLATATERTAALTGRAPSWRGEHPGAGSSNSLFRLANGYVELLARAGPGPVGDLVGAALERDGEGVLALAFGTEGLAGFAAALRARGLEVPEPSPGEGRGVPAGGGGQGIAAEAVRRWSSVLLPVAATRGIPVLLLEHRSPESALPAVAPVGAAEAAIDALDHVVVLSDDPASSGAFYGETLGLRLALDRDFEKRGVRILFFRVGGVTIEVAGPNRVAPDAGPRDRFGGLAYRVGDVERTRERLLAAEFDISEIRDGHKPGTRVCTVRSNTCGVPTLLIEPQRGPVSPGYRGGGGGGRISYGRTERGAQRIPRRHRSGDPGAEARAQRRAARALLPGVRGPGPRGLRG